MMVRLFGFLRSMTMHLPRAHAHMLCKTTHMIRLSSISRNLVPRNLVVVMWRHMEHVVTDEEVATDLRVRRSNCSAKLRVCLEKCALCGKAKGYAKRYI